MKHKIIVYLFLFFLMLFPVSAKALSEEYKDNIYDIVGAYQEKDKINIYFFYGDGCPHCAKEERFFEDFKKTYGDFCNIYMYETWYNDENLDLMKSAKKKMKDDVNISVPYTVIGDKSFSGYSDYVGTKIEEYAKNYLNIDSEDNSDVISVVDKNKEDIPFLGVVDVRDVSIGLVAIILGFIDGFNPCAMWVLLFLINMLIGIKDRRKMLIIGSVFLSVSAIMYFLFMLGITNILAFIKLRQLRAFIGSFALIVGLYNIYKFIKERKEDQGCQVIDERKRKKIFNRIKKFTTEKNLFLALGGVAILAISVNAIELACSSVFPATFSEILAVNEVSQFERIIYLIIYNIFYMLDDFVVFLIAVATLQISTVSSKYGKYSKVIGGIIMLLVGLLLIFKPEWLMFNF